MNTKLITTWNNNSWDTPTKDTSMVFCGACLTEELPRLEHEDHLGIRQEPSAEECEVCGAKDET